MKTTKTIKAILAAILALIMVSGTIPAFAAEYTVIYSEDGKTLINYPESLTAKEFSVPEGVEIIDENAFANNHHLETVNLPNTLKVIKHTAFWNCTGIRSISLPASLEEFYTCDNYSACSFGNCTNLEEIKVDENNKVYKSIDGVVYSKDGKKLIYYPINKADEAYSVVLGTEVIGWNSFCDAKNVKHVIIPDGVKEIEGWAFIGCSMETLEIPRSMKKIGWSAIDGCDNLKTVYYTGNVKEFDSIDVNEYEPDLGPDNTSLFDAELICEEELPFFENIIYSVQKFIAKVIKFFTDIRDRGQIPPMMTF